MGADCCINYIINPKSSDKELSQILGKGMDHEIEVGDSDQSESIHSVC